MVNIFLQILKMSYAAGWLILAVMVLRLLFRRAPKNIRCILWALVGIRLICPLSFESAFSLVPKSETVETVTDWGIQYEESDTAFKTISQPPVNTRIAAVNERGEAVVPHQTDSISGQQARRRIASAVWILGVLGLGSYALLSYLRLYHKIREGVRLRGNIWLCDRIDSPFILGVFTPRIFLPSTIEGQQMYYVLAHERAHLKRHDHLWKPLGFLVLCVHWFNPLVWAAYYLLCKDIELACDECVIRDYDAQERKAYSTTLLECSISRRYIGACPVAFGEVSVKERIKSVLDYKKPRFWVTVVALVLCIVVALGFMTNPQTKDRTDGQKANVDQEEGNEKSVMPPADDVYDEEEVLRVAREWGEAFCNRDAEAIVALAEASVEEALRDRELLTGEPGAYGLGRQSFAWPLDDTCLVRVHSKEVKVNAPGYEIYDIHGNQAEITYYAVTSDPRVIVWRETLTVDVVGDQYQVSDWELRTFDHIASGSEFAACYQYISGTPMDYMANGLGESLEFTVLLSSQLNYLGLFEPETAVVTLLNLLDNPNKVQIERLSEERYDGKVDLRITFHEDGQQFLITMTRLGDSGTGISGMWVPQDYEPDILGRFLQMDWNEIEARRLTLTEDVASDFTDILCIAELPGLPMKMYGYNDEEYSFRGVAIQIGEDVNYFDWYYATSRFRYPSVYWKADDRQLQVSLYNFTGTGVSAEELHVLRQYDTGTLTDAAFGYSDYTTLLEERIGFTYDEASKTLHLLDLADSQEVAEIVGIPDTDEGGALLGIALGDNCEFILGDTIRYRVMVGFLVEDWATVQYEHMPILEAPVLIDYDENGELIFNLGKFRVVEDWE